MRAILVWEQYMKDKYIKSLPVRLKMFIVALIVTT